MPSQVRIPQFVCLVNFLSARLDGCRIKGEMKFWTIFPVL